jgi:hypothetical protein
MGEQQSTQAMVLLTAILGQQLELDIKVINIK